MGPPEFPQKGPTIFAPAKKKIFGLSESSSKAKKRKREKQKKREYLVPTYLAS
jgi:hypothetical protein